MVSKKYDRHPAVDLITMPSSIVLTYITIFIVHEGQGITFHLQSTWFHLSCVAVTLSFPLGTFLMMSFQYGKQSLQWKESKNTPNRKSALPQWCRMFSHNSAFFFILNSPCVSRIKRNLTVCFAVSLSRSIFSAIFI